jgi:hypothetical protein
MKAVITPGIREVIDAVHYRPAVSVIVPFEPKMSLKSELLHALKTAADKAERELLETYPGEMAVLMMRKLRAIISNLNFNTHKKSIAIYVSPVFEKVLYLDIAVEKKVIVDESFEIRDLVYSKKELHKYLVLLLDSKESRMYLGNSATFVRIVSNTREPANAYVNDLPERVGNFSDIQQRKEIIMDKFLHHIDNALNIILNAYHLPLFVLAPKRILGHFRNITRHGGAVIEYIEGNYDALTLHELKAVLDPHVSDWKKVKARELLNQVEEAMNKKKLAVGMRNVWRERLCIIKAVCWWWKKIICMQQNVEAMKTSFIERLNHTINFRI